MNFCIICISCGVTKFVTYELPPEHKYVCGQCAPKGGCDPDPLLNRVPSAKHLSIDIEGFGWDDQRGREWVPAGFQVKILRQNYRVPEWVQDPRLCNRILESHGQYPVRGETWRRIIHLRYRMFWSSRDIAADLELSLDSVKGTLKKLNRRARNFHRKQSERESEIEHAATLFGAGSSVRAVSKQLGISVGKAWQLRVHFKGPSPDSICGDVLHDDFPQAQLSPPLESIPPELHV